MNRKPSNKQSLLEKNIAVVRRSNTEETARKQADRLLKRTKALKRTRGIWFISVIVILGIAAGVWWLQQHNSAAPDPEAFPPAPLPVTLHFKTENELRITQTDLRSVALEVEIQQGERPLSEAVVAFCPQVKADAINLLPGSNNCRSDLSEALTNEDGVASFSLTLPAENQTITVVAWLTNDATINDTTSIIIEKPTANVVFQAAKVGPTNSGQLKRGDAVDIVFEIENQGQVAAEPVYIYVKLPDELQHVDNDNCPLEDKDAQAIVCPVGRLPPNSTARLFLKLAARKAGEITISSQNYYVLYGANNLQNNGIESIALSIAELQPFRIALSSDQEFALADGQSTVGLTATVYDERDQPIQTPTNVVFTLHVRDGDGKSPEQPGSLTLQTATTSSEEVDLGLAKSSFVAGTALAVVEVEARVEGSESIPPAKTDITLIKNGVVTRSQRNLYPDPDNINSVLISNLPDGTFVRVIRQQQNGSEQLYYLVNLLVWVPRAALSNIDAGKATISQAGWIVETGDDRPQTEPQLEAIVAGEIKPRQISTPAVNEQVTVIHDEAGSQFIQVMISGWMPASIVEISP